MPRTLRLFSVFLLYLTFTGPRLLSQEPLNLQPNPGGEIFTIEFHIPEYIYRDIQENVQKDLFTDEATLYINDTEYAAKNIRTRGKSTLFTRRKSYTVKLEDHADIALNNGTQTLEDFYLISMSLDRNYVQNRLAFECLEELGIFPLGYRYVHLLINGNHEGIYLLVERPFDYAIQISGSPYAVRRLKSGVIDDDKYAKSTSVQEVEYYRNRFKEIHKLVRKTKGKDALKVMDEHLEVSDYMRWLAFNFLVRNGDYTDEVYYYIVADSDPPRFNIIPWDFDDILSREPHEGSEARNRLLKDKLIFSSEDPLDRKIASDKHVYAKYLEEMDQLLALLTPEQIKRILEGIYRELYPYYNSPAIIATSEYDLWGPSDKQKLANHLHNLNTFFYKQREQILESIDN